jgi:hypothetical protein
MLGGRDAGPSDLGGAGALLGVLPVDGRQDHALHGREPEQGQGLHRVGFRIGLELGIPRELDEVQGAEEIRSRIGRGQLLGLAILEEAPVAADHERLQASHQVGRRVACAVVIGPDRFGEGLGHEVDRRGADSSHVDRAVPEEMARALEGAADLLPVCRGHAVAVAVDEADERRLGKHLRLAQP